MTRAFPTSMKAIAIRGGKGTADARRRMDQSHFRKAVLTAGGWE